MKLKLHDGKTSWATRDYENNFECNGNEKINILLNRIIFVDHFNLKRSFFVIFCCGLAE